MENVDGLIPQKQKSQAVARVCAAAATGAQIPQKRS